MAASISQTPLAVETAQPSAPSLGKPKLPKMNSQLTTMLYSSPQRAMTMIGLVWLMLAV